MVFICEKICVGMWCSYVNITYGNHMWTKSCWYMIILQFICEHHMWASYPNKIMLVYDYSVIHMWTSYVIIISQQFTCWYMIILKIICEHHIPTSYTNNLHDENDVHIWFWVMFTYDFKWCLYMIYVYDAHMWCSHMRIFFPYMIFRIWCSHMI